MKITPLSYIELSRKNLIHNILGLKKLAKPGTMFSVAIKGNAYGHGQNEITEIIEPYVDYFQVDGLEELELLREKTRTNVLVLGYIENGALEKAMRLGCALAIFSTSQLKAIDRMARKLKIVQEIHLPVDALLGREGFLMNDLPEVFQEIKKCKFVKLAGMYAHFANIEDTTDFSHAKKQIEKYEKAIKLAQEFGFKNFLTHISATSGLLAYEKRKGVHPLIRLGLGVYGLWPSESLALEYRTKLKLEPALSWKTKIAQIKVLPKGMTIGYGLTYKTKKETKIALISQGYADGLDRRSSNNGVVLIRGSRCKVLGRVMMNMFVVDISHLKKVEEEEEVVILGRQGKEEITAEEIAERTNTINYEVITRISPLLPRVIK